MKQLRRGHDLRAERRDGGAPDDYLMRWLMLVLVLPMKLPSPL
jgi:hypothetical protein